MRVLYAALVCVSLLGCETAPSEAPPEASVVTRRSPPYSEADRVHGAPFVGVVEEVLPAGGYTYLRLRAAETAVWTVSLKFDVVEGDRVRVRPFVERTDFVSKKTGRTFPRLLFVTARLEEGDS